ncbi:MAG: conjugal transfer protein TraF [Acidobacteria bacterium]|nr:conjugal transfer protein TraF [Acidobacteriota bacterium]
MADAFVAVVDDATSVFWNPAGQATGALVSFVVDLGEERGIPDSQRGEVGLGHFVGFTIPPLGIAYYRRAVPVPAASPGTEETDPIRRNVEEGGVQTLSTSVVGFTVGQSLGDYLVVAATTKILRGEVWDGAASSAGPARTTVDWDAGLMATAGQWRAGVVVRNLTTPEFERSGLPTAELERDVRIGAAWGSGWPGSLGRLVVSADANLTRQRSATGDRRDVAAGAETWWWQQRLGLRGGVRASLEGEARPVPAVGLSAAVRPGMYVEAQMTGGPRDQRGWSAGARVTF